MNYIKLLSILTLVICSFVVSAQDRIYKKNGEIIDAKILKISTEAIDFKRFDNLDGPEYSIPKADVIRIKYANGTEDIFEENNDKIGVNEHGKSIAVMNSAEKRNGPKNKNIISFAPIQFTENGYGFGFSFERNLDKGGWVSFYCPAIYTFHSTTQFDYVSGTNRVDNFSNPMFYVMPGVKIYTNLNSPRRSKFAIGPSLVFGVGKGVQNSDFSGNTQIKSRTMLGALINFSGNYFPSPKLYIGYDIGYGFSYMNDYGGVDAPTQALVQSSIRFGYRYSKKQSKY